MATMQMYRLQGKTIKEISEIYDCSVGLVHKTLNQQDSYGVGLLIYEAEDYIISEEVKARYKKLLDERIPKIEALREKFGYYILDEHPEALERFEELMKDDIYEPFKTISEERRIDEYIRQAQGNIKHEGMYLTDEDKTLIKSRLKGEITKEQFIKIACEQAKEEAKNMKKYE